jgi:hypothetical protein
MLIMSLTSNSKLPTQVVTNSKVVVCLFPIILSSKLDWIKGSLLTFNYLYSTLKQPPNYFILHLITTEEA